MAQDRDYLETPGVIERLRRHVSRRLSAYSAFCVVIGLGCIVWTAVELFLEHDKGFRFRMLIDVLLAEAPMDPGQWKDVRWISKVGVGWCALGALAMILSGIIQPKDAIVFKDNDQDSSR